MPDDRGPLDHVRAEVHAAVDSVPTEQARAVAVTEGRRTYRRSVIAAASVAVLVSVCLSTAAIVTTGRVVARVDQAEVQVAVAQQIAEDARTRGDQANQELERRGQAPVPIPPPGTTPDTDVLVASAAARVLASIPDPHPTAAELAAAIATHIAENPIVPLGPSPQQINEALAGYLLANPPPPGPTGEQGLPGETGVPGPKGDKGDQGTQGDPPTADQIRAALDEYIRDHPDVLCPKGGTFAQLRVQLADGGQADTWQCVVSMAPPTSTPGVTPTVPVLPT